MSFLELSMLTHELGRLLAVGEEVFPKDSASSGLIGVMTGAAGGVGFAIWYGWYITTKQMPQQTRDFAATIEKICVQHDEQNTAESTRYRETTEKHFTQMREDNRL